ncbi:hypothetical protein ACEWY4_020616 [Coilia grayii]|uniref:CRIB domain-containing protein n=1 Tax=Coilia grayii TaxID=363190 RepID=A0ABD1J6Q4_9TELE
MPAKTPIYLKTNHHSKRGRKCRLRDILSPDMISPPLGDFRHTVHIGKGGARDTFGDVSFLQGNFELLPGKSEMSRPHPYTGQYSDMSRSQPYAQHSEFLRANSTSDASFAETPSPVLKNAISLPTIGSGQAITLPHLSSAVFPVASDPLDDPLDDPPEALPDPTTSSLEDGTDEEGDVVIDSSDLEILQYDSLLRSITIFGCEPSPPPGDRHERPAFAINLVETPEKPQALLAKKKITPKIGKILSCDNSFEKKQPAPSSFHINGNINGHSNSNSIYNGNGNCNISTNFNGFGGLYSIISDKDSNGSWADRDSGVEDGRMCDFDLELAKEKSVSQESLSHITGSLLSLELDLGPSILDDVLNIMDKPQPGVKV